MTLREFAERVLFSNSLQDKLAPPDGELMDERRGDALAEPAAPGRPTELCFSPTGQRGPEPKSLRMDTEKDRGVLMHFFANHELLATELMALALLKFPEAPPAFRKGLLKTLRDEQDHTRLYMERMAACGVQFGEYPVNGFFWRCISGMATPLDYVSRLSLTFEQANLDFSCHYAQVFGQAGDAETAALLERIYKDEIVHVGYGLKWFRRWKGEGQDDWQAFCQALPFPLSPARAKGAGLFNAEGRRRAGLDPEFIAKLELFSFSLGRTPWVHLFNPGAEACAAKSNAQAAEAESATMQLTHDLDTLPLFLANAEDVVLLRRPPREEFLRELKQLGLPLAEREILDGAGRLSPESPLRGRKLGRLRPWGWSADSAELLGDLEAGAGEEPEGEPWNSHVRMLYAKATSLDLLRLLDWQAGFGESEIIGTACDSLEAASAAVEALWQCGKTAVVKANFGIAGRKMVRLEVGGGMDSLADLVSASGGVVVEPWLERVEDFSVQYELRPNEAPRLKGLVRLHCDAAGRWVACAASHQFSRLLSPEAARFFTSQGRNWLKKVYGELLPAALQTWVGQSGFRGMLGVDAFLYRTEGGQVRLKPVVEVNPRCTMGRVALELANRAAPGHRVLFRIFSRQAGRKAGHVSLAELAGDLRRRFPLVLTEGQKVRSGVFFLNDALTARNFLGAALVSERTLGPAEFAAAVLL